jgi:hypothetical protein
MALENVAQKQSHRKGKPHRLSPTSTFLFKKHVNNSVKEFICTIKQISEHTNAVSNHSFKVKYNCQKG